MAAQHLAATKIQGAIRRFLYLKRKEDRKFQKSNLRGSSKQITQHRLTQGKHKFSTTSEMQHLSAGQRLRQKFFTSPFNQLHKSEDQCFKNFCAAVIQATYKMALTKRLFKYHRFAMYHIAAIQIQWAWRAFKEKQKKKPQKSKELIAVEKIQKAWRAFTNVKIFKYYKDLINFKEKGDPSQLLKSVNPSEAGILDAASKCHIRFRLGGDKFPPLIYYKIFTHGSIIDIGAFAPRDYVKIKKEKKKQIINIKFDKDKNDKHDGWYNRFENNGWRPISDKILTPYDTVELRTANKPKKFHFNKAKRKEMTAKEKRTQKLKWLRKLYKDAKNAEIVGESPDIIQEKKDPKVLEQLYENPFDDNRFLALDDQDFENEVNNLIEWCEDLDYEKYINNWHQLATSAYVGLSSSQGFGATGQTPDPLNYGQSGFMGNQFMQGQEPYDAEDLRNSLGDRGYASSYQQQQIHEENFLKQNLDYENRLKEHIYQFEENKSAISGNQNKNGQKVN